MEMTYGINITSNEDKFLRAAVEAVDITTRAMIPGTFLVDIIPMRTCHATSKTLRNGRLMIELSEVCP